MCDPITLGLAALSGGAALFGASNSGSTPPPAVMPAPPPTMAKSPGADVKIGDGADKPTSTPTPTYDGFTETRTFGKPLGGLGRGGLGL